MKILHFGMLYFRLPDDFEGGLSEALRAFADYHDEKTGTPNQKIGAQTAPPDDMSAEEYEESMWAEFYKLVHETDLRVHGTAGLSEYPDEGEGEHLDLNTGEPDDMPPG
ncbi:hypothetical protein LCGC14_0163330 [marine sediment metagenome]|uniref:Uncharacterized protein n=1 Tax=marine sediment metagenome TaxID=412755 RepID=A0A0F9UY84_9ZZZZ